MEFLINLFSTGATVPDTCQVAGDDDTNTARLAVINNIFSQRVKGLLDLSGLLAVEVLDEMVIFTVFLCTGNHFIEITLDTQHSFTGVEKSDTVTGNGSS